MREPDFDEALEIILSIWPVPVLGWIYPAAREALKTDINRKKKIIDDINHKR